jgi:hypothetical protein
LGGQGALAADDKSKKSSSEKLTSFFMPAVYSIQKKTVNSILHGSELFD